MTVIFEFGTWWIDIISIASQAVSAASGTTGNIVIAKTGRMMGYSQTGLSADTPDYVLSVRNRDNSAVTLGDLIDNTTTNGIEWQIRNNDGSTSNITQTIMLFMRQA